MRLAPLARVLAALALTVPVALAATGAEARGCGRHGGREAGFARFAFDRAVLSNRPDCLSRDRILERRGRRAAHGGYYEVHGRYQH